MDTAERSDTRTVSATFVIDRRASVLSFSKTLIYETALRQNRVGDVIADITRSLDTCSSKLSLLIDDTADGKDMKHIELSIAKFRILLNDIELISYDIEQLKQNDSKDRSSSSINRRWKDLLEQATGEYHRLEGQFERMKSKHKFIDRIEHELDSIDRQVHGSTIDTKFSSLIERLEQIEGQINEELVRDDDKQIHELKGNPLLDFTSSLLSSLGRRPIDRRQATNRDQRRRTGRISTVDSTVSQISGQIHRLADRE